MVIAHKKRRKYHNPCWKIQWTRKQNVFHILFKTDALIRNNYGNPLINNKDEESVAQLCLYFTEYYKSYKDSYEDPVTVSNSIDATKIGTLVAIHRPTDKILCDTLYNHSIEFPENDYDALEIIENSTIHRVGSNIDWTQDRYFHDAKCSNGGVAYVSIIGSTTDKTIYLDFQSEMYQNNVKGWAYCKG